MSPDQSVRNLAILRLAVGIGAWVFPNLAGKLFGLKPERNPQAAYLSRLFGVRDVALAIGTSQATGEAQRAWLRLGVLCDAADTAAAALGQRGGYLSTPTALMVGAPAVAATALGASALQAPSPTS